MSNTLPTVSRRSAIASTLAALLATRSPLALAQNEWPKGAPLKVVVPFTAGSAVDAVARVMVPELSRLLETPVIVDNRPGAGGSIGTNFLAHAPADGFTLMIQSSALIVNPHFIANLPYDTVRDIRAIAPIGVTCFVMVTSPDSGIKSAQDLVGRAKAKPGQLNYGSGGVGSGSHLSSAKFAAATGIDARHVPSRGTAEALTETMAGRLDWVFAPAPSVVQLVRSGKLLAIAVSTSTRSGALPDVRSMTEAGFSEAAYAPWIGVFVPSKTPPRIIERLNQTVLQVTSTPSIAERLRALGAEPFTLTSAQFDKQVSEDLSAMGKLVKVANIKTAE